jgi:hypothetical protein
LLDSTEEYVQKFYDFLGESFDAEELSSLISTAKKGNFNKWKSVMTSRQITLFDKVAANTLNRFGYETFEPESELGNLARKAYILHDKIIWLKFMFKTNVIDGIKIRFFGKQPFAE